MNTYYQHTHSSKTHFPSIPLHTPVFNGICSGGRYLCQKLGIEKMGRNLFYLFVWRVCGSAIGSFWMGGLLIWSYHSNHHHHHHHSNNITISATISTTISNDTTTINTITTTQMKSSHPASLWLLHYLHEDNPYTNNTMQHNTSLWVTFCRQQQREFYPLIRKVTSNGMLTSFSPINPPPHPPSLSSLPNAMVWCEQYLVKSFHVYACFLDLQRNA